VADSKAWRTGGMRRTWLPIALVLAIAALPSDGAAAVASTPARGESSRGSVVLIRINGSINPAVVAYIEDSLDAANKEGASVLVIQLDTPGGLLNSTQRIVKDLLGSAVPVIVYVAPSGASAASAGMFITEAANIAAMAPGTTIGAAHPVESGGGEPNAVMGKKIENFAASFAKTVAQERGHNPQWVEDAVRNSAAIGDREALSQHVVDIVARDLTDLLLQSTGVEVKLGERKITLMLTGAAVHERTMSLAQRFLNALADPNLVYLLLMGGLIGLYFEFAHPGVYMPGVAGAICLLLALTSFQVLPINLSGLLLLLLGVGLLISEAFLTSYGILGIGGIVAFVIGSLFLIDGAQTTMAVSRGLIAGAALALTAIIVGLGYLIVHDRRGQAATGREGLIGEVGEVRDLIAPGVAGRIFVHGEHWRAVADELIASGERAQVTAVHGIEVEVRRIS
jgi:membrane-bound serine protease (ClpP class)